MSAFTAYFDASGSPDQNVLAVAGFVATTDAWIRWEEHWLARLDKDGLEGFHNKDLVNWEPQKKQCLINDLCGIIREHVHFKAGVVVVNSTIDIVPLKQRENWFLNPYTLACRNVAKEIYQWAASWGGRSPELFYEKGDNGQEWLDKHFEFTGCPRPNIRSKKDLKNKKTGLTEVGSVAFQAADLFAYQIFSRERVFRREGYIAEEFARIHPDLDKIPGRCGTVTTENIRFLKSGLEQDAINSLIIIPNVKIDTK